MSGYMRHCPCRNCLIRPVCVTNCEEYKQLNDKIFTNYHPSSNQCPTHISLPKKKITSSGRRKKYERQHRN